MKLGERLRILRKTRKMTLQELSKKSGVQVASLSRMENNAMTGTLRSHVNICEALGISLVDFYREAEDAHKVVSLIKPSVEPESFTHSGKFTVEMLTTKVSGKRMLPVLVRIQKGGKTQEEKSSPGTEKFIYVLEGRLRLKIGKEFYDLRKGDSIYFDASLSHYIQNPGKAIARALSLVSPTTA